MINPKPQARESGKGWLVQLHPLDLEQGKIELDRATATIGRSHECRISLDDASVSWEHAKVQCSEDGYEIVDLDSTNGVLVNDAPVAGSKLSPGDRIQLGSRIFRFLVDNDDESKYYETVYGMMTRDGLTGAFNKRYLTECLDREVIRCCKYQRPLSVIMIDIDHFKSVNDTHGHLAGDDVLRELSARLQREIQDGAVFARFGGEEFAIVAAEMKLQDAEQLAESCRQRICEKSFSTSAGELDITISLGVASPSPESIEDRASILSSADMRLYEAKRGGRNRVVAK
ncbi:MAG: diguanylate cyclase [Rubripirellula sp.]